VERKTRNRIAVCTAVTLAYWGLSAIFCSPTGFLFALLAGLAAFALAAASIMWGW
jgi:hypothetical protein